MEILPLAGNTPMEKITKPIKFDSLLPFSAIYVKSVKKWGGVYFLLQFSFLFPIELDNHLFFTQASHKENIYFKTVNMWHEICVSDQIKQQNH